jgi:hypothetical protein
MLLQTCALLQRLRASCRFVKAFCGLQSRLENNVWNRTYEEEKQERKEEMLEGRKKS